MKITKNKLNNMHWQELRRVAEDYGVPYTNKGEVIDKLLEVFKIDPKEGDKLKAKAGLETHYVVLLNNHWRGRRGSTILVDEETKKHFKRIGLIK